MQRAQTVLIGLVIALSLSACSITRPAGTPEPGNGAPSSAPPGRAQTAAPATVNLARRYGDNWLPVTPQAATAPHGPAELRLAFSKPVRRGEVEQALLAAQAAPVRGLMTWLDDQTLIWQIQTLPARLDVLLGGAHDQDGLPLPGGVPSLRLGKMPTLVTLDPAHPTDEKVITALPADIATARLIGDSVFIQAWQPGTTRWDWTLTGYTAGLATGKVAPGNATEAVPRAAADLEEWEVSPSGALVAGLKGATLVISDLGGGRRITVPEFIHRDAGQDEADKTVHLAWSPDNKTVAALTNKGATSDLVAYSVDKQRTTTLMADLPVRANGAALAWSTNPKYLLAGNVLVDLESRTTRSLERQEGPPLGRWSPDGAWLAYQPAVWGPILLIHPASGADTPVGAGLLIGWAPDRRLCVVRWAGSEARYEPVGMQ